MTLPYRPNPLQWPISPQQLEGLNDTIENIYTELRRLSSAGGGAHDILSDTHTDTVVATAVDGDILIRSGGKWIRLAKGTNKHFLQLVAGLPAWGVDGSLLTNLNAAELTGTVPDAAMLHNLLSSVHQDTVAAAAQLGDFIVAQSAAGEDIGKYWLNGEGLDLIPTSRDPSGQKYWLNGLASSGSATLGLVRWQRKEIGPAGTVPVSDGSRIDWQALGAISGVVGASVYRSGSFVLADQTPTAISFETEVFDDGGFWESGAPTRLTVPSGQSGLYAAVAQATWPSVTAALRIVRVYVNGSKVAETLMFGAGAAPPYTETQQAAWIGKLNAGDYVEAYLEHRANVVGSSYTIAGGSNQTFLQLAKVA